MTDEVIDDISREPTVDALGKPVEIGDVIQIDPAVAERGGFFAACFALVTETKGWGVQCFIAMPGERGSIPGAAYYRAPKGEFVRIGKVRRARTLMQTTRFEQVEHFRRVRDTERSASKWAVAAVAFWTIIVPIAAFESVAYAVGAGLMVLSSFMTLRRMKANTRWAESRIRFWEDRITDG